MAFEPDIIVTSGDSFDVALVIETKINSHRLDNTERQLKSYMAGMRSPVGILVTPEKLRLYSDQYLPSPEESIRLVGEFEVRSLLRFGAKRGKPNAAAEFETAVQSWIEGLTTEAGLRELPPEFKHAAQLYILPALSQGELRAAHPRPIVHA